MARNTRTAGTGGKSLPASFTHLERDAYDWLLEGGFFGWVVDLLTHRVKIKGHEYDNLVEYRKHVEEVISQNEVPHGPI